MRFVEDDQVEESRRKLFVVNAHVVCLLGRHIKPLIGVYVRRADAHAGLIWEMSLETVVEGLFSGPRRGGIVRDIFEDDPWTKD
jgi:hypothetical protein